MATVYSLICNGGSSGSYWNNLSATQKLRYGASGSERVYNGIAAFISARASASNPFDPEICEIADAFTDTVTASQSLVFSSPVTRLTTLVDGIRKGGFHGGTFGGGYVLTSSSGLYSGILVLSCIGCEVDGIDVFSQANYAYGIWTNTASKSKILNSIIRGTGTTCVSYAVRLYTSVSVEVANNIICKIASSGTGIRCETYSGQVNLIYNNLITKCGTGLSGGTGTGGFFQNNISIGNTTNWGTVPAAPDGMAYNMGASSDTPWDDGGATSVTTSDTSPFSNTFADWTNDDYRPASSSSPQVNAALPVYLGLEVDIAQDRRPNYEPSIYPNEVWDLGPFEFDHGNGLPPVTVEISITGMVEGSAMAIYNSSTNAEIVAPTTIGASGAYTDSSFVYTSDVPIKVVVRKGTSATKYLPYNQLGTITSGGFSLIVTQIPDTVS